MKFEYEILFEFAKSVFLKLGCPQDEAELATKVLLSADLRGVDSHGVARLSGYVRLYQKNRLCKFK
jgi:LDH2 family malate/lactate/ureidoglycolate dehydrogenase